MNEISKKDPGIAAVLNFLWPGLGFIYCEELELAFVAMLVWVVIMLFAIHGLLINELLGTILVLAFYFGLLDFSIRHVHEKNKKEDE